MVFSNAYKNNPDRSLLDVDLRGFVQNDAIKYTAVYYDNNSRIWQHNDDKDFTSLLNIKFKSVLFRKLIEFKTGFLYRSKSRYNSQNNYVLKSNADPATGTKPIYTNIYNQSVYVYDSKGTYEVDFNNYTADEKITSAYFQGKSNFGSLQILTGVRVENTYQHFDTKKVDYIPDAITGETINYIDILPSIHFKFLLNKKQNIRLSYFTIHQSSELL